jgi:hypothetical protein
MKRIVLGLAALSFLTATGCGGLLGGLTGGGQSQECKDYVDCAEKVSPGTRATNETSFGPNGSCFSTGVKEAADQCTAQCKGAVQSGKHRLQEQRRRRQVRLHLRQVAVRRR